MNATQSPVYGSSSFYTLSASTDKARRRREKGRGQAGKAVCARRHRNDKERGDRDKEVEPYVVSVVTPPPRPLGTHRLAPNMQCGETVEVKGECFVVSGVTYRYSLRNGRYRPSEKRLDVQSTGRYFLNLYLDDLLEKS